MDDPQALQPVVKAAAVSEQNNWNVNEDCYCPEVAFFNLYGEVENSIFDPDVVLSPEEQIDMLRMVLAAELPEPLSDEDWQALLRKDENIRRKVIQAAQGKKRITKRSSRLLAEQMKNEADMQSAKPAESVEDWITDLLKQLHHEAVSPTVKTVVPGTSETLFD